MASWEAEIEGIIDTLRDQCNEKLDLASQCEDERTKFFYLGISIGHLDAIGLLRRLLSQHYADMEDASRAGSVADGVAPSPVPGPAPEAGETCWCGCIHRGTGLLA